MYTVTDGSAYKFGIVTALVMFKLTGLNNRQMSDKTTAKRKATAHLSQTGVEKLTANKF